VTNRQNEKYLEKKEFNETENEIDIRGMDEMGKGIKRGKIFKTRHHRRR